MMPLHGELRLAGGHGDSGIGRGVGNRDRLYIDDVGDEAAQKEPDRSARGADERVDTDGARLLARIVEAYLDHLGIPAEGVGSWTVKNKRKKLGAEADECYVLTKGPVSPSVKVPDLVIEVVHSAGSLDKLDVWQKDMTIIAAASIRRTRCTSE